MRRRVNECEKEILDDDEEKEGSVIQTNSNSSSSSSSSKDPQTKNKTITPSWLVLFWFQYESDGSTCTGGLPPMHGILRFVFYGLIYLIYLLRDNERFPLCNQTGMSTIVSQEGCYGGLSRFQHYQLLDFPMKADAGLYGALLHFLFAHYYSPTIPSSFPTPGTIRGTCTVINRIWQGSLLASAVGVGNKLPRLLVCLSWWLLFGIQMSSWNGSVGHSLYVVGVAFCALLFTENNQVDAYSVDSLLYQQVLPRISSRGHVVPYKNNNNNNNSNNTNSSVGRCWYLRVLQGLLGTEYPTSIVIIRNNNNNNNDKKKHTHTHTQKEKIDVDDDTGTTDNNTRSTSSSVSLLSYSSGARKFILCTIAVIMFNSGLHKLIAHGLLPLPGSWWDGQTIYQSVTQGMKRTSSSANEYTNKQHNLSYLSFYLKYTILEYPILATIMAGSSIIGEMGGAILIVISTRYRVYGILLFTLFHIGIFLTMVPNFVLNIVAYLLVIHIHINCTGSTGTGTGMIQRGTTMLIERLRRRRRRRVGVVGHDHPIQQSLQTTNWFRGTSASASASASASVTTSTTARSTTLLSSPSPSPSSSSSSLSLSLSPSPHILLTYNTSCC